MIVKYCIIILIVTCLWKTQADVNNVFFKTLNSRSKYSFLSALLKNLLETCDLGSRKIIIYDNFYNSETFNAIAERQPNLSASLFTDIEKWKQIRRYQFDDLRVDAVIIVVKVKLTWLHMQEIFNEWRYNRDCIVYILVVEAKDCESYKLVLSLIMRFYIPKAYFICFQVRTMHVYTHDPYGDTQPLYWHKINQGLLWGKNWTFYTRSFSINKSQLCRGFDFKRTDPSNQKFVIFGLSRYDHNYTHIEDKTCLYADRIVKFLERRDRMTIAFLEMLMKRKFLYLTVKVTNDTEHFEQQAYDFSGVDGLLIRMMFNVFSSWNYFYPIVYEPLAILSHNRGSMTPLEKITKFYGKWTLSSLIIILMITFVVMWFSTKRFSFAIFNVLRLLINAEIVTPMNTWRLKLFFSMIFLYFLVIHATFSGHLAEFLTKVEYRPNIDTLEQLKDPDIEKIYNFGYIKHRNEDLDFLPQKLEFISRSRKCKEKMNQTNHACIAPMVVLKDTIVDLHAFDTLYISKNTFGLTFFSYPCRPGFPLREKFDWAFIFLFDTGIITRWTRMKHVLNLRAITQHLVLHRVNYRTIKISDVSFAFIFFIIGNFLGFLCFIFEITSKNQCNKLKCKTKIKPDIVNIEVQPDQH